MSPVLRTVLSLLCVAATALPAAAEDDDASPKPVPLTRPEVKAALDILKQRTPRLPLPPAEDDERGANNGRMRALYLPAELRGGRSRGGRDAAAKSDDPMKFDYAFSTMLFWITSRVNNCHYCLGHQENKLLSAGVEEDRIAALDGDWSSFTPAEREAFHFARKLTYEPFALTDADLAGLKEHYADAQVLELVLLVSRYNATNRWTDALGIPQEDRRVFLTKTSPQFVAAKTQVAPVDPKAASGDRRLALPAKRPALESRAQIDAALEQARRRTPRLPLVEEEQAREVAGDLLSRTHRVRLTQWVRLLANFPDYGGGWIGNLNASRDKGMLQPQLKAEIAWIAARNDRAWYALGHAEQRLEELGVSRDRLEALRSGEEELTPAEAAAFGLAEKLTAMPQHITDEDIARVRKHYSDHETAEIVYHVTLAAFFNRVTEAAGLRLEE